MTDLLHIDEPRSTYRVSIERPSGLTFACDRREKEAPAAAAGALLDFYARHPEGTTEELRLYVVALNREDVEGVPA